jgi:hypothetical protein
VVNFSKLIGVLIFSIGIMLLLGQVIQFEDGKPVGFDPSQVEPTVFYKVLTMGVIVMVAYALTTRIMKDKITKKDVFMLVVAGGMLYWLFSNIISPLIFSTVALETQSLVLSMLSP